MAVVKSNKLIDAGYKLPAREQIFVLYLISKISMDDETFVEYNMHWKDIEKILNFDGKRRISKKEEVFDMMNLLNTSPIRWESDTEIGQTAWVSSMRLNKKTEVFRFQLAETLRPYLLQLKEHFTQFNLKYIVYLNGKHIRFYELMKRYEFRKEVELTVENIRFCLGYESGEYKSSYDFRRYVLLRAQKELKEYTDIQFEFEVGQKKGKTPVSYIFKITKNTPAIQYEATKLITASFGDDTQQDTFGKNSRSKSPLKLKDLSRSQMFAYTYLEEQGVNQHFILSELLTHGVLSHEMAFGYEDHYAKIAFQIVLTKSNKRKNGSSLAGVFVTWWRKNHLHTPQRTSLIIDSIAKIKKSMTDEERDNRRVAATMTKKEFIEYINSLQGHRNIGVTDKIQSLAREKSMQQSDLM